MAFCLNTPSARAISATSSERFSSGTGWLWSPAASAVISPVICASGRPMLRPITKATKRLNTATASRPMVAPRPAWLRMSAAACLVWFISCRFCANSASTRGSSAAAAASSAWLPLRAEIALISLQQRQLRGHAGLFERGTKGRDRLLEAIKITAVAAQDEILFMPAQRQHHRREARIGIAAQRSLDAEHGRAQRALQAAILVIAQAGPELVEGVEPLHVELERRLRLGQVAADIVAAGQPAHGLEFAARFGHRLAHRLGQFRIGIGVEIPLAQPAAQEGAAQLGGVLHHGGGPLVGLHQHFHLAAHHGVKAGDDDKGDQHDHPNADDFGSDPPPHARPLWMM